MNAGESGFVFRRRVPAPPLSAFIDHLWYFHGLVTGHDRERVLPDGSGELIVNLQDLPHRRFDREDPARSVSYRRAWISGTQTGFLEIDVVQHSSLMGVHFQPGGLAPFVPGGGGEVGNQVIEADAVWGPAALDLHDALRNDPTIEAKFDRLEAFLARLARHRLTRPPCIAHAVDRFSSSPHQLTILEVVNETGLSHKQFIERFRTEVGVTPKRFCRIRRFQRALDEIEQRRAVSWPELALACGYYDQAHFINEFRTFSGLNPRAYLREAGDYRNFVPLRARGGF